MSAPFRGPTAPHVWTFHRKGGLDQVALASGADLLALGELDKKLWVALSCPTKGIHLDETTLAMIDADQDGRIRVPELLAAIRWAAARLKDPGDLLLEAAALPLAAIDDSTPEGAVLLASARQILARLGRPEASSVSAEDTRNATQLPVANAVNGDGVIPPQAAENPAVQALIADIITCMGATRGSAGVEGVTAAQIDAFFAELKAYQAWVAQSAGKDIAVLGETTDAAVAALKAVRSKVDEYFDRCRLAAFDPRAAAALNRAEQDHLDEAARDLTIALDEVAGLPLASTENGRPLPLLDGVNPAWAGRLSTFQQTAVAPVLGKEKTSLTETEWLALNRTFAPYETWLGGKTGGAAEKLGLPRIKEILSDQPARDALNALVTRDQELGPAFKAAADVARLAHYRRDMRTLLNNFVNFSDFYSRERLAVFQAGMLFLDSRCTELCIEVAGPTPLAAMSKTYIAYCDLKRSGAPLRKIAACFTQGDSDYLFVGRNGVFYDREGRDWDATITAIVDNPISVRQAFFSPYKKFVRLIEEQVAKRAAAAEAESSSKLATTAEKVAKVDQARPPAPRKMDIGVVAALGVAFGALTTAFGYLLGFFRSIAAWQIPLVLVAIVLLISLPSMIIAALKLRHRTLGPLLDATGWAVNGRVKINAALANRLTRRAKLPPGARRSLADPYADNRGRTLGRIVIWGMLSGLLIAAAIRWDHDRRGHYFWEPDPVEPVLEPAAPPTQG